MPRPSRLVLRGTETFKRRGATLHGSWSWSRGEEFMLDILERAPGVKLLVTAREALNLQEVC